MFVLIVLGSVLLVFAVLGGGLAFFWKSKRKTILRRTGIAYLLVPASRSSRYSFKQPTVSR